MNMNLKQKIALAEKEINDLNKIVTSFRFMWKKQYSYYKTPKARIGDKQYDSKFEANYGQELEILLKAGKIEGFETHVRIPLIVNGYTVCDYYIDFVVFHKDGTVEYIETKGYPTSIWKLKWKIFLANFEDDPSVKITLVMQGKYNPPKLRKHL